MITLADATTTIELPGDLAWLDEFAWSAVERAESRSLTGALIRQAAVRQAGRPLTLAPPEQGGWWPRNRWPQVQAWLDAPEIVLTLTLRGSAYQVAWRAEGERPGAEAEPVLHESDPAPESFIRPTFRFVTI